MKLFTKNACIRAYRGGGIFSLLLALFSFAALNSCLPTGLGEEVDLEAPVLKVTELQSGENVVPYESMMGGVYCHKAFSVSGIASDNNRVTRVYAEIKYADEEDYTFLTQVKPVGDKFTLEISMENEGSYYLRIAADDPAGNIGNDSSRVITLFVDENAPVAEAWYIDRGAGTKYGLKSPEELDALDLDRAENRDAAQNESFTICASVNDTMGVDSFTIKIVDESGATVYEKSVLKSDAEQTDYSSSDSHTSIYSPKFEITHEDLVERNETLSSGKHILTVLYDSADIVTVPNANKAKSVKVGSFIWWPESDKPRIWSQNMEGDTISARVGEQIMVTVFDDDALKNAYFALLTEEENQLFKFDESMWDGIKKAPRSLFDKVGADGRGDRTEIFNATKGEIETTIALKTASTPQAMCLYAVAWDNTKEPFPDGRPEPVATRRIQVNVTDDTTPILLISSPKTNTVPAVSAGSTETSVPVKINGKALDLTGCAYLEFVWVASDVSDKKGAAQAWLGEIVTNEEHESILKNKSETKGNMKIWGVPLGEKVISDESLFITNNFSLDVDLLNDFGEDKAKDKYFLAKLTRNDGNFIYQEYKLAGDTEAPTVEANISDMQTITDSNDRTLRFKGVKPSGLPMKKSSYKITCDDYPDWKGKNLAESDSENDGYDVCVTLKTDVLKKFKDANTVPRFLVEVEDIFGNKGAAVYNLVIGSLPELQSIDSSAAKKNGLGKKIDIVATFDKVVTAPKDAYIRLDNFKGDSTTRDVSCSGGSGTTQLHFEYTVKDGDLSDGLVIVPVDSLPIAGFDADTASFKNDTNYTETFKNRGITVDGQLPKVKSVEVTTSVDKDDTKKHNNYKYLKAGTSITAVVSIESNDMLSPRGNLNFRFQAGSASDSIIELPFTGYEVVDTTTYKFTFMATIAEATENTKATANGTLSYPSDYIDGYKYIQDTFDNELSFSGYKTDPIYIVVDTVAPVLPTLTARKNGTVITLEDGGKYNGSMTFSLRHTETAVTLEHSFDGGTTWITSTPDKESNFENGEIAFMYRAVDYAGNVTTSTQMNLDIQNTFPTFTVECLDPDGNYKAGTELRLRVNFDRAVNVPANSKAYILVEGKSGETFAKGKNEGKTEALTQAKNDATYVDFIYKVQDPDQFTLVINKIDLSDFTDAYGSKGSVKTGMAYSRAGVKCDGVAPKVMSMTPKGTKSAASDRKNVYTETSANTIELVFSEEIQKSSGNITLRQVADWSIPPVLTASEFSTIKGKISAKDLEILSMQENGRDMEDSENLLAAEIGPAQEHYHGTGQYVGPYKKSTQGLKLSGGKYVPDTSTKYVLAFDMDIDGTTKETPIGRTFEEGKNTPSRNQSKDDKHIAGEVKTPTTTRTTNQIREVLERAGFHERVLDVTSDAVSIDPTRKVVTIKFPEGLTDTSTALPKGRKWELVIDKGAFMDDTGNEFGANNVGVIEMRDSVQAGGKSLEDEEIEKLSWGRYRKEVSKGSSPVVLVSNESNEYFWSGGVATPVVRVDRYSYRLGVYQSDQSGAKSGLVEWDNVKPTGWVRVRIDCETPGATIKYNDTNKTTGTRGTTGEPDDTNTPPDDDKEAISKSYISSISDLDSGKLNGTNLTTDYTTNSKFACGSGDYKLSAKQYVIANASANGATSERGLEGVFQTVVLFNNPIGAWNTSCASIDVAGGTDVSIRGTTGWAGEPYIAPFPLRDSQVGSPFLCRTFRERTLDGDLASSNDYYWVSYEILVDSSFSNYSYHWDSKYDWAKNWGLMRPGEFTNCVNMRNWGWKNW